MTQSVTADERTKLRTALVGIANIASVAWQTEAPADDVLRELGKHLAQHFEAAGMTCEEGAYEFPEDEPSHSALHRPTLPEGWTAEEVVQGVRNAAAFLDCQSHPDASEWANACRFAALYLDAAAPLIAEQREVK